MKNTLVDTGIMVALFNAGDNYYSRALEFIKKGKSSLYTTMACVTETVYLLDYNLNAQTDFIKWVSRKGVIIVELDNENLLRCAELMTKYSDLPMDFADATVVSACEKLGTKEIVTIDSDFEIYRYLNKQKFKNLFV